MPPNHPTNWAELIPCEPYHWLFVAYGVIAGMVVMFWMCHKAK